MVIVALTAAALLVTLAPSGIESPEGVERKAGGEKWGLGGLEKEGRRAHLRKPVGSGTASGAECLTLRASL